jgi:trehalose 6-phosphate synthase
MIRDRLPDATIITFWHIPWPNPRRSRSVPGASSCSTGCWAAASWGFTPSFTATTSSTRSTASSKRASTASRSTVAFRGQSTSVHRYPISIEWPPTELATAKPVPDARRAIRERHRLPRDHRLGIGIDRLDYTKGIIERMNAWTDCSSRKPRWIDRFTFVQIAAPSRSTIDDYRDYAGRVRSRATEINARYADAKYPPIIPPRRAS